MQKTKIDWTDSSWNPVTGCLHDCPYCYAKGIARRFGGGEAWDRGSFIAPNLHVLFDKPEKPYPFYFAPTLHSYRMNEPAQKSKPQTIFVGSMADIFGTWVPDEWISEVFKACEAAPQHRYLFLTKNPARYLSLAQSGKLPANDNWWFGTTITTHDDPLYYSFKHNTFVSIEPILAKFESNKGLFAKFKWAIIGAESGSRKDKVIPEKTWIADIAHLCAISGIPVFMKDSLIPIVGAENILREFPWKEDKI